MVFALERMLDFDDNRRSAGLLCADSQADDVIPAREQGLVADVPAFVGQVQDASGFLDRRLRLRGAGIAHPGGENDWHD